MRKHASEEHAGQVGCWQAAVSARVLRRALACGGQGRRAHHTSAISVHRMPDSTSGEAYANVPARAAAVGAP